MKSCLLLLLFAACQENAGSIVFAPLYSPPLAPQFFSCSNDPRKATSLHVHLTADSQVYDQTVPFSAAAVQFDIPLGSMRTITMDVLNPQGCTLYTGTLSGVSFAEGNNASVKVPMHRPSSSDYNDADHDGLTTCVERALGTMSDNADSDGDGYSDFCEVTGGCTSPTNPNNHPNFPPSNCNPDGGVGDGGSE